MFSVSQLNDFGRQYYYLVNFRGLIARYIVLYFLPQNPLLRPTNYKIRASVGSQDGAYFHWSVPTSLCYLPTNLHTSVVDFIYVRPPVESALHPRRTKEEGTTALRLTNLTLRKSKSWILTSRQSKKVYD